MNFNELNNTARRVLGGLVENAPKAFSTVGAEANARLDVIGAPFEERRYIFFLMGEMARTRAMALGGPSAKVLLKLAGAFMDQHARWAGVGFWSRRAPHEEETKQTIARLSRVQQDVDRSLDIIERAASALNAIVLNGVEAIDKCGGFKPQVIDARTTVQLPAQAEEKKTRSRRVEPEAEAQGPSAE